MSLLSKLTPKSIIILLLALAAAILLVCANSGQKQAMVAFNWNAKTITVIANGGNGPGYQMEETETTTLNHTYHVGQASIAVTNVMGGSTTNIDLYPAGHSIWTAAFPTQYPFWENSVKPLSEGSTLRLGIVTKVYLNGQAWVTRRDVFSCTLDTDPSNLPKKLGDVVMLRCRLN